METSTNTNTTNTTILTGYGTLTSLTPPRIYWWLIPYVYVLKGLSVAYMDQVSGRVVSCKNWGTYHDTN